MNKDTLSVTDNNEDLDFADLAEAVANGTAADLDRLMGKEVEEEEEATSTEDADNETQGDKPQDDNVVEDQGDTKTEAATAASTDTTEEPDELTQLKTELHRLKSDAGRVPFLQRRMQEMDRELRAYKARAATTGASGETQNAAELPEAVKRRIEALREIDPDLAETLEAMHTSLAQEARGAKNAVETLTKHEEEQAEYEFYMEQKTELLREVPQAEQIFATPEWKQWKENLTPGRRAMVESGYASDMVPAIYAFAADMQRLYGNNQPASQSVATSEGGDPTNMSAPTQQVNNAVQDSRARKVQVAAEVKNPAAKASVTFDSDSAFKEAYAKILTDMNIR